jgi:hypothetical protein
MRMVSKTQIIGQSQASAAERLEIRTGVPSEQGPAAAQDETGEAPGNKLPLDPTRYGDWEKNGRCIDF